MNTPAWKWILGFVAALFLIALSRDALVTPEERASAATKKAEADRLFQAEDKMLVEKERAYLNGPLLSRVALYGLRGEGDAGYVAHSEQGELFLLTVTQEDSCGVSDPTDFQKTQTFMRQQGVPMSEDDAAPMRHNMSLPVFLQHYQKTGWKITQGDESCWVDVGRR